MKPLVHRGEALRERVNLIPKGVRVDDEAVASHGPDLPLERQMVQVLGHRDVDGEVG